MSQTNTTELGNSEDKATLNRLGDLWHQSELDMEEIRDGLEEMTDDERRIVFLILQMQSRDKLINEITNLTSTTGFDRKVVKDGIESRQEELINMASGAVIVEA